MDVPMKPNITANPVGILDTEASEYLGKLGLYVSTGMLRVWRNGQYKYGPRFHKVGRWIRYDAADLDAWARSVPALRYYRRWPDQGTTDQAA